MNRLAPAALLVLVVASSSLAPGLATGATAQAADDAFWSHRFSVTSDVSYGARAAQKLDLYLRGSWVGEPTYFERAPDPRPTLIFIHGGGWIDGDKAEQAPLFLPFLERGWHVVSVGYRLGPDTAPAAVDDAVCALGWVVEHADEYGFDTDRVVVAGASAGGHLALMSGILGSRTTHECAPGGGFRVAAVVNWFGITDIEAVDAYLAEAAPENNYARAWIGNEAAVPEISDRYSPLERVDDDAPPILTLHGEDDTVVPFQQATTFHARLEELGVTHRLEAMDGGTHMGFSDGQFQRAFGTIFRFLDRVGARR